MGWGWGYWWGWRRCKDGKKNCVIELWAYIEMLRHKLNTPVMLYLNYLFLIFEWSACKLAGQAKCNFHYKQALLLLFFYTFACSYLYNYNNSDCEAYICKTFNNSRFIMSFATGKQATNIQIGPPVMPFSPTKTSEKCSVPSNPDVHNFHYLLKIVMNWRPHSWMNLWHHPSVLLKMQMLHA